MSTTRQTPVVLVIEDVAATQNVIGLSLQDLAVDCVFAGDGLKGLEKASALLPDVIVLDLALPLLAGDEVLRLLRADRVTAHIPVLVVTAHGQSGMAKSVLEIGANGFMEKPFLPAELRAEVKRMLSSATNPLPATGTL